MNNLYLLTSLLIFFFSLPGREQATNLYEWALLFHLYVSNRHPNTDLLLIALLELLDVMLLEILYIHPRGIQYRLIPTSLVGILGIVHYAYALRCRSDTYPLLQSIARFPELALIGIIVMCTILHGVAIVVTGGNVRRRFFLDARTLPTLNQDYTMALYQVGTACVCITTRHKHSFLYFNVSDLCIDCLHSHFFTGRSNKNRRIS